MPKKYPAMKRNELGTIAVPKTLITRMKIYCSVHGMHIRVWAQQVIEKELNKIK